MLLSWVGRGNVFRNLKRYDEAHAAYAKALSLKPELADTYWAGFFAISSVARGLANTSKALCSAGPTVAEAWLGRPCRDL